MTWGVIKLRNREALLPVVPLHDSIDAADHARDKLSLESSLRGMAQETRCMNCARYSLIGGTMTAKSRVRLSTQPLMLHCHQLLTVRGSMKQ